jgi:hypothetical protein
MSIAAVLCGEAAISPLSAALDAIVTNAAATYGVDADAEIHTTDMVSRKNGWEQLPDVDAAISIVHQVLDAVCAIPDVQLVMRGLDVLKQRAKGYPEVWEPRRVAMQHVLEHCNGVMRGRGQLMVVADEMSKPAEHRDLLKSYRAVGTPGFRQSYLERILDNIYFMPSHYARILQAADVIANVHRREHDLTENTDSRSAAATKDMWAKLWVSGKVRAYGCWP